MDVMRLIEEEYMTHNDHEDEETWYLKEALRNALSRLERRIFITWLETGTYKEVARKFRVSAPTVSKYIAGLKAKIVEYVDNNYKPFDD